MVELGRFRSFDAALTLGYATKLHPDWGIGFNFRLIHSRLSDKPAEGETGKGVATSISFDIAAMWRPSKFVIPLIDEDIGNSLVLVLILAISVQKFIISIKLRQILFQLISD